MASSSTSSASASKRKRTDEEDGPAASAVAESWSSFFNAPDADVILRSVDGCLFATRRAFLVAASAVFDDMFSIPQPSEEDSRLMKDGQAAPDALDVVHMGETGNELEPFLRWIHRDTFDALYAELEDPKNWAESRDLLVPLLACAKKFDANAIFSPLFNMLKHHETSSPVNNLVLAVIYGRRSLARGAVTTWMSETERPDSESLSEGYALCNVRSGHRLPNTRPWMVTDIWSELVPLLPVGFFIHISEAEKEMLYSLDYNVEATVDTFMAAFDAGFPLECTSSSLLYVTLLSYRARTGLIPYHALSPLELNHDSSRRSFFSARRCWPRLPSRHAQSPRLLSVRLTRPFSSRPSARVTDSSSSSSSRTSPTLSTSSRLCLSSIQSPIVVARLAPLVYFARSHDFPSISLTFTSCPHLNKSRSRKSLVHSRLHLCPLQACPTRNVADMRRIDTNSSASFFTIMDFFACKTSNHEIEM